MLLIRIICSISTGIILTIVVAWSLAARIRLDFNESSRSLTWAAPVPRGWPAVPTSTLMFADTGWQWIRSGHSRNNDDKYYMQEVFAWGWPMICMRSNIIHVNDFLVDRSDKEFPAWLRGKNEPQRFIPLDVIWFGFIINTLLGAIFVYAGWWCVRLVRQRRAKSELCPKCGYDLSGCPSTRVCSECGTGLRGQNVNG